MLIVGVVVVVVFFVVVCVEGLVMLYGMIDMGVVYLNYVEGGKLCVLMLLGVLLVNEWGLIGSEVFGGDMNVIFMFENNFDVGIGQFDGGWLFGLKVFVGVVFVMWGMLMFGWQNDLVMDFVQLIMVDVFSGFFVLFGDVDNYDSSVIFSNVVKWMSVVWYGVMVVVMVLFGGVVGVLGLGFVYVGVFGYVDGLLSVVVGYLYVDNGNVFCLMCGVLLVDLFFNSVVNCVYVLVWLIEVVCVGVQYVIGNVIVGVVFSFSEYWFDVLLMFVYVQCYWNGLVFV